VPETATVDDIQDVHGRLGKTLMRERLWPEACIAFGHLRRLLEQKLSANTAPERSQLATVKSNLGVCFRNAGNMNAAKEALDAALGDVTSAFGDKPHPQSATIWSNLGAWHEAAARGGPSPDAVACYSKWAGMLMTIQGADNPQVALPLLRLAKAQRSMDKAKAKELYERALKLWDGLSLDALVKALPEAPNADRVKAIKTQAEQDLAELLKEIAAEGPKLEELDD
jgi:tetratricopeptide (TPR) repeat protein